MHYDYMSPWKNKDGSWTGKVIEVPLDTIRMDGEKSKEVKTISLVTKNTEAETIQEMKIIIEDLKKKI